MLLSLSVCPHPSLSFGVFGGFMIKFSWNWSLPLWCWMISLPVSLWCWMISFWPPCDTLRHCSLALPRDIIFIELDCTELNELDWQWTSLKSCTCTFDRQWISLPNFSRPAPHITRPILREWCYHIAKTWSSQGLNPKTLIFSPTDTLMDYRQKMRVIIQTLTSKHKGLLSQSSSEGEL